MTLQSCWATVTAAHAAAFADPEFGVNQLLVAVPVFGLMLAVLMAPMPPSSAATRCSSTALVGLLMRE